MSCNGSISNFERKKQSVINVNKWKSNFISIWEQYGVFKYVGDVRCFDYYDIDGPGEGQKRMSKHLKQPTLWQDTMDSDLDWVHLVFDLSSLITIDDESVAVWLADYKLQLEAYTFDRLVYEIEDRRIISHAFYLDNVKIDDPFLDHLSLLIAERRNADTNPSTASADYYFTYDELVTIPDVQLLMDKLPSLPMCKKDISAYLLEQGIGTDILDQLVMDGKVIGIGSLHTGTMTYALPVDVARKMNGYAFVKMVEAALDFRYKVDSHWYDFFLKIIKLVLAVIAVYFGFYSLAASLTLSFAADVTGNPVLKVLATISSLWSADPTSLVEIGASEAVSLLLNVYALYVELSFNPEQTTDEEVVDNDQEMFYKAPYSAYNDLYCYKSLTSVSTGAVY